jgi:hypothetical protein
VASEKIKKGFCRVLIRVFKTMKKLENGKNDGRIELRNVLFNDILMFVITSSNIENYQALARGL